MSKIVCDVCGTSYPETAEQCPICGCVRSGEPELLQENLTQSTEGDKAAYIPVKGGRFSKANVKKRAKNGGVLPVAPVASVEDRAEATVEAKNEKSALDKWLTVAIIVLILSILAVVLYIAKDYFHASLSDILNPAGTTVATTEATQPVTQATAQTTQAPETTLPPDLSCQALTMESTLIELDKIGAAALLNIEVLPEGCTDTISYTSSNEAVATVSASGKVIAVGNGTADITASCGIVQIICTVVVNAEEPTTAPTTEPTTAPTTAPTEPPVDLKLNRSDFTLTSKGESWVLYDGSIDKSAIKWYSDNNSIATFKDGEVVAVGPGGTQVHAEYKGVKVSCWVRCVFSTETTAPTTDSTTAPTEAPTQPESGGTSANCVISHSDVTIAIGETFSLTLKDSSGNTLSVTWMITDTGICSANGNSIKGVSSGLAKVYTTYGGSEYACIVRVKSS